MKAILCKQYGSADVLAISEVEKPNPKENEILVKNHASTVTISDCIIRSGKVSVLLWLPMRIFVGFKKPRKKILGMELSGEVIGIGKNVKHFKLGDKVIAFTGKEFGAYAEYSCINENGNHIPKDSIISLKPDKMTYEEAAALPSRGLLALYFIRKGNIRSKQKVLIFGASGGVGTFAVQLAKYYGAEVTGVCSTNNIELVKSLGADKVIDYKAEDFKLGKELYDLIFDAIGKRFISKKQCKKVLTINGKFISVDELPKICIDDFLILQRIINEGKLRSVIDRCYSLDQIVEAHKYVEKGHKKGNVIISINS